MLDIVEIVFKRESNVARGIGVGESNAGEAHQTWGDNESLYVGARQLGSALVRRLVLRSRTNQAHVANNDAQQGWGDAEVEAAKRAIHGLRVSGAP